MNIDFAHVTENPLINGIEILRRDQDPPGAEPNDLRTAPVTTTGSAAATPIAGALGIDWTQFRGSFVAGGKLWYGKADGTFNSRTYSAGSFGPEVKIDPYNDPAWAGVDTGSGNTFDGNPVNLYSQLSGVTGMAYAGGKLYYTKTNDSNLYWRWFNADSGIVGSDTFTANGGRELERHAGAVRRLGTAVLREQDRRLAELRHPRRERPLGAAHAGRLAAHRRQRLALAGPVPGARQHHAGQRGPDGGLHLRVRRPGLHLRRLDLDATATAASPPTPGSSATAARRPARPRRTPTVPPGPTRWS